MTLIRIPYQGELLWDILEWLEKNIGAPEPSNVMEVPVKVRDYWRQGNGWKILWEDDDLHWPVEIDDPEKATLFVLRWL